MSRPSPVSQAMHDGFREELLPLLAPLGFVMGTRPPHLRPGYVWLQADLVREGEPDLSVVLWCSGGTGDHLRMRVERGGHELSLQLPWTDPASPGQKNLSFAASDFRTGESIERLRLGIRFLAGGLAATVSQLHSAAPVLAQAAALPAWKTAAAEAERLFRERFMRSDFEDAPVPGKFVFVGAGLVTVEAAGDRFTFKFDTSRIDRAGAVTVSGWWKTPAGTKRPSVLKVGEVTLTFDQNGALRTG